MLQTNNERYGFHESVLKENRFKVNAYKVQDFFEVDIPLNVYREWNSGKFDEFIETIIKPRLKLDVNHAVLTFNWIDHYSPDLYVAIKEE